MDTKEKIEWKMGITANKTFLLRIRILIIIGYILFFTTAGQETAFGETNPYERDFLVRTASKYLYTEKFDSVFLIGSVLQKDFPDDPVGYFIVADAYGKMMRDYRVRKYEAQFDSLLNLTIEKALYAIDRNPSAENLFILGAAKGYKSLYQFRRGLLIDAIYDGVSSINVFKTAIEFEPGFSDPLLGLALYEYAKLKAFKHVTFRPGKKKEQIISNLKLVHRRGKYLSISALYSLQNVYFDSEQDENAIEINDLLFSLFPNNPAVLYNRALLNEKSGRFSEAIVVWNKLILRIETMGLPSFGYLAECHYTRSKLFARLNYPEKSRESLTLAVEFLNKYDPVKEIDSLYIPFRRIEKGINEMSNFYNIHHSGWY